MLTALLWLTLSFTIIWIGSGVAVRSIARISTNFKISSFLVSFLLLGVLTSLTETFVGFTALLSNEPEIFVGNLLGSSMLVFLFIIPLLAVLSGGITLNHFFKFNDLRIATLVVGLPALLTLDGILSQTDALVMVLVYAFLLITMQSKREGPLSEVLSGMKTTNIKLDLLKVLVAVGLMLLGGQILIKQTVVVGELFSIQPFVLGLIVVSLGTNVPEISIGIRSLLARKKGIAFGTYLGSASYNTLLLGVLSFLHKEKISADGSNYSVLLFAFGLLLFLKYARSKNTITRTEGLVLLLLYLLVVVSEFVTGPGWGL